MPKRPDVSKSAGTRTRSHKLAASISGADSVQTYFASRGSSSDRKVRFGSVIVEGTSPSKASAKRNVEAGRLALSRVSNALVRPGVEVHVDSHIPLYHADPAHPGYLIRTLNGQQSTGRFVNGKFKSK
jgi:hypothetical protein